MSRSDFGITPSAAILPVKSDVDQQFRGIETKSVFRLIRTVDAKSVILSRTHAVYVAVPDAARGLTNRDGLALRTVGIFKEAKIHRFRVVGINGKIHARAVPSRALGIGFAR